MFLNTNLSSELWKSPKGMPMKKEKIAVLKSKKIVFGIMPLIVVAVIGTVAAVLSVVINRLVEKQIIDSVREVAQHDRNTVSMFVEFNWKNLRRAGMRLKRNADSLGNRNKICAYLGNEMNESAFDNVFILFEDGTYYTDLTYCGLHNAQWYDYKALFTGGRYKAVGFDRQPYLKEDKAIVYGYKFTEDLADITLPVENGSKNVFGLIGVCKRKSLRDGIILNSFADDNGNYRGASAIITSDGSYIVNRDVGSTTEATNWLEHIDICEDSDISRAEVESRMRAKEAFWFFHKDGAVREINYCEPFLDNTDWYFLFTVSDAALREQTSSFVLMIMVSLSVTVIIIIAATVFLMLMQRRTVHAQMRETVQSEFLSNMSHEIRTPLNGLVGLNYLMTSSIDNPKKKAQVKEWLTKSNNTTKYLLSLVNDVLDISKMRAGKMKIEKEPVSLEAVIDAIYSMQFDNMEKRGINYVTDIDITVPYIMCDDVRLKQVLMNIVGNAAKFTPKDGEVKLTVRQKKADERQVITTFICEDTGCGMSEEFLPKIFELFEQDRNSNSVSVKGTGLGMAISKMIIEAMGGSITVESQLNKGSKFTVTIPAEIAAHEECDGTVSEECDSRGGGSDRKVKILVAEDNELNAEILMEILADNGFDAVHAENGSQAVELFKKSETNEFSLILMDMRMPIMDGYEAAKAIRKLNRPDAATVPIFACTANSFQEDRLKALECGMNDFLTKPVDIAAMLQKLAALSKSGSK